jgi:putative Mn2+ efflux pump MntP
MDILNALLISLSMALDATCVGAADGMLEGDIKKRKILLIAFTFGLFQFVMPTIGYFIGFSFSEYISPYIPRIAFVILLVLGVKSIVEAIRDNKKKKKVSPGDACEIKKISVQDIFFQGLATSIDAFTIGFIYTDKSISEAIIVFTMIGIITFLLSFLAIFLGKKIGNKIEKIAPFVAAIVFIALAIKFLVEQII